jgi:hypothetical protein
VTEGAFTFSLEHSTEGRIRGWMYSRAGNGPLRRVQFDPQTGELTFSFPSDLVGLIQYRATVKDASATGALDAEELGFTLTFTARRTSSEVRQPEAQPTSQQSGRAGGN